MRPRAAATNSDRAGSARPSAPASRTAVSWRAVRLMPRSRSLTDRGLTPAALASSCCVSRASARSCRSNPANPTMACSAMTAASPPPALSPPAATSTAREGPVPKIIQARRPRHQSRHRPARSPGPQRPPGGPARRHWPPARSCRPAPCTPPADVILWVSCAPHGCGSHRATATPGPTPARAGLACAARGRTGHPTPAPAHTRAAKLLWGPESPRSRGPWRKVQQRDRPPLPGCRTRLPGQGSRRSRRYGRPARRERGRPSGVNR